MTTAIDPVVVPSGAGSREPLDLGAQSLNLQRLENPQVSVYQCSVRFGSQTVRSIFEKLAERGRPSTFEEINLADNLIGNEGAQFLAAGLAGNTSLKQLNIARTGIAAEGFQALGPLLANSPTLEDLVLSGNICDASGVEGAFSNGLQSNTTLKSLYIAACRLGDQGVKALCDGPLKGHTSLQHVSLSYNRLESSVVASINAALATNKVLQYLDLSGNSLGKEGAQALAQGLKGTKTLQKLSVAQNCIYAVGAKALSEHFMSPEGANLTFLDLRHNSVGYHGVREIREMCGRPIDSAEHNDGWLMVFGERQLYVSGL